MDVAGVRGECAFCHCADEEAALPLLGWQQCHSSRIVRREDPPFLHAE